MKKIVERYSGILSVIVALWTIPIAFIIIPIVAGARAGYEKAQEIISESHE